MSFDRCRSRSTLRILSRCAEGDVRLEGSWPARWWRMTTTVGRPLGDQPLNRQSERYAREGVELSLSMRHVPVAKAMDYMLKRWEGFTRFLDDGRICLTNNAAERALREIALGRKSWLFAGSERGGERAAAMYTLIVTANLNDVDPQAWLADVLARIAELPHTRVHELLPWNWKAARNQTLTA